ncbi:hypothetical protein RI367_000452 [Sorochytrium milnesiophthora]
MSQNKTRRPVASPIFDVRSLIAAAQEYHALSQSDGRPVQLEKLEEKAFPWLLDPVSSLRQQWTPGSRGIVFTFTKSDSIYAYTLMRAIRHLGSQLPIVVMYGGASDLPDTFRAVFEEIRDISFVDMSKMLRWDVAQVKTYAHKPFAMLFAPFEEVMVVDADAGFFQAPDPLFDDVRFRETGTLFFSDRSVLWTHESGRYVSQWVRSLLPNLSDAAKSLRVFRGVSNHEQESAVVLINKRGAALHGLLLACALNAHSVRPDVYRNVLGDKETYWIAFEALGLPYAFMPVYAGAMGFLSRHWYTNNAVCGFLIHFDRSGQPLWWNGGVVHDRNPPLRYWNFTHYKADTTDSGAEWQILPQEENQSCLHHFGDGDVPANAVQKLPQQDIQLVQWMHRKVVRRRKDFPSTAVDMFVVLLASKSQPKVVVMFSTTGRVTKRSTAAMLENMGIRNADVAKAESSTAPQPADFAATAGLQATYTVTMGSSSAAARAEARLLKLSRTNDLGPCTFASVPPGFRLFIWRDVSVHHTERDGLYVTSLRRHHADL